MLFDLRGRRRRAVQATYLTLAVLMGGGLVFFGIGGDVSGGLFDAFSERGGGDEGTGQIEERIEQNEERSRSNPQNAAVLATLVRDNYQLATSQTDVSQAGFPDEAKDDLREAGRWWQRYLAVAERPDPSLANLALQVYDVPALNQAEQAQEAAAIIAEAQNDSISYLRLVQYATLAGDTRTADLAGQKAIDLAPKGELKVVREQVEQAKQVTATPPQGQAPQGQ
jgi:hypothetical protein